VRGIFEIKGKLRPRVDCFSYAKVDLCFPS